MFAFGPLQTWAVAPQMSAFEGKADIAPALQNVLLCPKADIELHWPSTAIMTLRAAACRLATSGR